MEFDFKKLIMGITRVIGLWLISINGLFVRGDQMPVKFKNAIIKHEMLECLGSTGKELYKSDLLRLKNLTIGTPDTSKFNDLENIDLCTNLCHLNIYDANIKDLHEISLLKKLESLSLIDCTIDDVSALNNLHNLVSLDLEMSNINNPIPDLGKLSKLTDITIQRMPEYIDFSFLKNLKSLTGLQIKQCGLGSIDFLKNLTNINFLMLSDNEIKNINVLRHLKHINILYIFNNQITDMSVLKFLPNLQRLSADNVIAKDKNLIKYLKAKGVILELYGN